MSAKCSARIAEFEDLQYFRDGKHRFYFETRCNRVCHDNMNVCLDCSRKNPESRTQYSRTFNHGLVTEPIPDKSDIYGGKRYVENAKKWGPPGGDVLREAERKRALSNGTNAVTMNTNVVTMNTNVVTMNTNVVTMNTNIIAAAEYKVIVPISEETAAVNPHTVIMPKKAKETAIALDATTLEQSAIAVEQVEKKVRKRPQASEATKAAVILALAKKAAEELEVVEVVEVIKKVEERVEEQEQKVSVVKVVEKVAAIKVSEVVEKKVEKIEPKEKEKEPKEKEKEKEKEKKPRAPRKKKIETPYTALSKAAAAKNPLGAINKQEVCIPTHIEKTLETVDTDGYEIEYVRLTKFEHSGIKYFRDMKKQKLYERVKDTSVGKYVGRYDSYSDSIIEDVPDSDSE